MGEVCSRYGDVDVSYFPKKCGNERLRLSKDLLYKILTPHTQWC
jgi:hypothetical protein